MKAEQDAVVAALKAAWPQGRVYSVGGVPTSPVSPYMVVSVDAGESRNYRAGSRSSSRFIRIAVQNFGKDFTETSIAAEKADATLLDSRVLPAATPCRRELATPVYRDPDGPLLMTTHTYTFTKPA